MRRTGVVNSGVIIETSISSQPAASPAGGLKAMSNCIDADDGIPPDPCAEQNAGRPMPPGSARRNAQATALTE
jgi:hypothetical protein